MLNVRPEAGRGALQGYETMSRLRKDCSKRIRFSEPIAVKWAPEHIQLINQVRAKLMAETSKNVTFSELVRNATLIGAREMVGNLNIAQAEKEKILTQLESAIQMTGIKPGRSGG